MCHEGPVDLYFQNVFGVPEKNHVFTINGKYTVPLVIDDYGKDV